MTLGNQGSNASQGGKGSGIVGFQKVTIGKNRIPTAGDTDVQNGSYIEVVAYDTTPYTYEAYSKMARLNEITEVPDVTGVLHADVERADAMLMYGINPAELDPAVDVERLDEALSMLEEAVSNYQYGHYRPGSRDHDPSETQGLACDAYEMLGYDARTAYNKVSDLFMDTPWEGPDFSDFGYEE